jgi:ABC-type transporter Mla subunit MlaD
VAGFACLAALAVIGLLAIAAGGSNKSYEVRAIFDDAGNLIAGENVAIAGVKVGTVRSVEPTPQAKAAVVLNISNPGFQNFRQDASCTIRPQGLIGEKYVDCEPTQPRVEGTPLAPSLRKIPSGHEGEGEYYLPVTNNHSPVDPDLVGDINRLPERERFTLIINELGAGLMGRGSDLNAVIRRANPALQELDRVLHILANENHVLAELAVNSDKALKPFAEVRQHVADFIVQSNKTAQAGAKTRAALQKNLELFPKFLEVLVPSVERLGRFAEATTPTFTDLGHAANGINQTFTNLPAFSQASTKFLKSTAQTSKSSGPALVATKPLLARLSKLGNAALPASTNLTSLLTSFRGTGGLERLLDFIFLGAGAANGYDSLGHFLRTEGLGTACLTYNIAVEQKCNHKLFASGNAPATAAAAHAEGVTTGINVSTQGVIMARTLAVIKGATPEEAIAKYPGEESAPPVAHAAKANGSSSTGGTSAPAASAQESKADSMLLNYLLGGE